MVGAHALGHLPVQQRVIRMRTGDASIYSDYIAGKEPKDRKRHNTEEDPETRTDRGALGDIEDRLSGRGREARENNEGRAGRGDGGDGGDGGERGNRAEQKGSAGRGGSLEREWRGEGHMDRKDHKGVKDSENEGQEQDKRDIGGKGGITGVRGFKKSLAVFTLIVIVTVVAPVLYTYVIPRSELTITTVYHETTGTGSVGYITVALKVTNTGTTPVEDVNVTLHVINGSMDLKGWSNRTFDSIGPRQYRTLDLSFAGSHYKDYMISISVRARIGDEVRQKRMSHDVIDDKQPYMNIEWADSI